jgi:hypothetical protein
MMTGQNPSYEIEVSSKAMTLHEKNAPEFIIILGFTSAVRHVRIKCSTAERTWSLVVYRDGQEEFITQVYIESIRTNVFYDILIQVRGDLITLDVDGMPIFTNVKLPYPSCLSGFVGVLAADSKCALKNWKFREGEGGTSGRAISVPSMNRDAISGTASSPVRASRITASSDTDAHADDIHMKSKKTQMKSLSELLGTRPGGGALTATATADIITTTTAAVANKVNNASNKSQPSDGPIRIGKQLLTPDVLDPGVGIQIHGHREVISEVTEGGEFINKAAYEGQSQSDKLQEVSTQLHCRHDKNIVDTVLRDVIQHDLGVTFDDIASVADAKRLLNEAVVLPMIMPEFFTGIREPWKVI